MQKIQSLIILLLVVSFGTYIYYHPPISKSSVITPPEENAICSNYNNLDYSKLPIGLVSGMIEKYRQNQLRAIDEVVPNDANSIWFDLDTLKKFMYHIEKGVQTNSPNTAKKLGIRIYYAAYPENTLWDQPGYEALEGFLKDPITREYQNRHSLVMLPTILNKDGLDSDFNPFDPKTYNGYNDNTEIKMYYSKKKISMMALTSTLNANNSRIMARNHGTLSPPNTELGSGF